MRNILILTDFSPAADNAVLYGFHLATRLKADNVLLCNVMNIPAEIPQFEVPILPLSGYNRMVSDSANELQRIKNKLRKLVNKADFCPEIICIEEVGRVTDVVFKLIHKHHIDLITVGIHTKKGLVEWSLGNHVQELIESAGIPTLIVPVESTCMQIHKIAFFLSHHKKDSNILPLVTAFSKKLNAKLILVYDWNDQSDKQIMEPGLPAGRKENIDGPGISVKELSKGPVEKHLKSICETEHVDLLVMVHSSRNLLNDIFLRSRSRRMARITNLPLLIVPENISSRKDKHLILLNF